MFRQLARWYAEQTVLAAAQAGNPAPSSEQAAAAATARVFDLHPLQLERFMEEVWAARERPADQPSQAVPQALLSGQVPGLESAIRDDLWLVVDDIYDAAAVQRGQLKDEFTPSRWQHLIYGYMIEQTRVVHIFRRVLAEYLHGERLEVPSEATHRWLRTTEALFYRDLPSASIAAVTSSVRPDLEATRRNAYWRMFGMDISHGREDGQPYTYQKAQAANSHFVEKLEELLREGWIGKMNELNTSGSRPTDDAAIATYARDLHDMMTTRRERGNLSREEFVFTTMLSWFHLTLEGDTSVVADLKATATSPEERLRKIGERVGLPPHRHSESFLILGPAMSTLLRRIEAGDFTDSNLVRPLYTSDPTVPGALGADFLNIVNHWSIATGRDMKARPTTVTERAFTPPRQRETVRA
jgi:hypothetical protein